MKRRLTKSRSKLKKSSISFIMPGFLYSHLLDVPRIKLFNHSTTQDRKLLAKPNEEKIKQFYNFTTDLAINIPELQESVYKEYLLYRSLLDDYYEQIDQAAIVPMEWEAAKELGNIDPIKQRPVIENNAECNLFHEYLLLYREKNCKRYICDWLDQNSNILNKKNQKIVLNLNNARFAVLRLEQLLPYNVTKVVDIISKKEYLLIDKGINTTQKEGFFLICSIIEIGNYIMTANGGIPFNGYSRECKAILTIVAKHLKIFRKARVPLTREVAAGVKEIYSFCLRNDMLDYITVT